MRTEYRYPLFATRYARYSFTLAELLVAIGIIALLVAIAVPTVGAMFKGANEAKAINTIKSALSLGRTIATQKQTYAGVRFQRNAHNGKFYAVIILHDPLATNLANGFLAAPGVKPMPLPQGIGLVAMVPNSDSDLNSSDEIEDHHTFSIVFGAQGNVVVHKVRVRNRDGESETNDSSKDGIFNTPNNVEADPPFGMFYQDSKAQGDPGPGSYDPIYHEEFSTLGLYIADLARFDTYTNNKYSGYLADQVDLMHLNVYTGEVLEP